MIECHIENKIASLVLNRPEKRNALDDQMAAAIHQTLIELDKNPGCKVLIIKAKGEAFCAGADLGYLQKLQNNSYEENLKDSTALMAMFKALDSFSKITISQVEGAAFAGGCGLAGLCDFSFATPDSKFAYTEVKIGFIPAIVSVFLSAKIGENKAKEMFLSGKIYSARDAHNMQLINDVIPSENMSTHVQQFAQKLVENVSTDAIKLTKQLLRDIKGKTLDEQLTIAAQANAHARSTKDCKKGIQAFLNKEKLIWD
jgi:methylglutaconyl-CoA hydratase